MNLSLLFPVLLRVLGGLALFLFGMGEMTEGLQQLAGPRLRSLLQRATRRRLTGFLLGTTLGFFLHSSGATVLLVGFLNAGLIQLVGAVPLIFGANVGTTLAMQVVSFKMGGLAYPALVIALWLRFRKHPSTRAVGRGLFGLGLLFLGMEIMSAAVLPHRDALRPFLQDLDASTLAGLLRGILLSLAVTVIIQSSGATIGMGFALVLAGVFHSITQTAPIVLGAHIGTCVTALLASIGGQPAARRAALAHLAFNLFNVSLAILLRGPLLDLIARSSPDLVRQTANLHSAVMLGSALVLLPFSAHFAAWITRLSPSRQPEPEASALTDEAFDSVHTALPAVRQEFSRLLHLAEESLELNRQILETPNEKASRRIRMIEDVFDSIKLTMIAGLRRVSRADDASRSSLPLCDQWTRCMVEMERIGDHLNTLRKLSEERRREPGHILFGRELSHRINELFSRSGDLLGQLRKYLAENSPEETTATLDTILRERISLLDDTQNARQLLTQRLEKARIQPRVLYYFSSYLEVFERLARHVQVLATTAPAHKTEA